MNIRPCRRLLVLLSLSLLLVLPASAQEEPRHSLNDGAWALQFGIRENLLVLGSFAGGTISAKHHYSDATALRYGLTLHADAGDEPQTVSVGLEALYLVHPDLDDRPGDPLQLFWGAGPTVGYERREQTTAGGETVFTQFYGGVAGAIGAEWFVIPRISLTAEYGSSLQYARTSTSSEDPSASESSSSRIRLSANGVRFGVSVYVRAE